jgi:mono/diheme cytochrome c family protein
MRKLLRTAIALAGLLGLAASSTPFAAGTPTEVKIDLPPETAQLKPGPGMETTGRNCLICHSVDYIYMQPPLTKDQWNATVTKMKKVFGAPVPDNEVETIVNYLMTQNGKK